MIDVMTELLFAPFAEFGFMQRALLGSLIIACSAAPVGVFLMLRRMSLTGDAMAHAILPGAAVGYLVSGLSIGAMTLGGLVAGCLVVLFSGWISRATMVTEEASLAAFYLISLALGVLMISGSGSQLDLLHILFGSALALDDTALYFLAAICTVTWCVLAVMFRALVLECVDRQFLQTVSGLSAVAHFSFLILVVLNLVVGFNALGTLMSVGIMILPAAIARYWFRRLEGMLLASILTAFLASYVGLVLSYHLGWSTGPVIILVLGVMYLLSTLLGAQGGIVQRWLKPRHLTA